MMSFTIVNVICTISMIWDTELMLTNNKPINMEVSRIT